MLRQDYITRMVQEMVRMLLKLMFGIEAESPDLEMFRDAQARERTERLLMLADEGRIDEAENELSDILESCVPEHMQTGLLFYWTTHFSKRTISAGKRSATDWSRS